MRKVAIIFEQQAPLSKRLAFLKGPLACVIFTRPLVLRQNGRQPAPWYAVPDSLLAPDGIRW
jgi:hypothetical protein